VEDIGDLAILWRIKGSSSFILFPKPSHLDYLVYILYPMCLLAVTCAQLIYIESYSPLACVWLCTIVSVCICCALLSYIMLLLHV
jgi:hypothetical protein